MADEATETTIVAMPPPACYPLRRVAREYGPAVLYIYAPSEALISIDGDRLPREAKPFRVVHLAIANPRGCDVAVSARVEQTNWQWDRTLHVLPGEQVTVTIPSKVAISPFEPVMVSAEMPARVDYLDPILPASAMRVAVGATDDVPPEPAPIVPAPIVLELPAPGAVAPAIESLGFKGDPAPAFPGEGVVFELAQEWILLQLADDGPMALYQSAEPPQLRYSYVSPAELLTRISCGHTQGSSLTKLI